MGCGNCKDSKVEETKLKLKDKQGSSESPQKVTDTTNTFSHRNNANKNTSGESVTKDHPQEKKTINKKEATKENNKVNQKEIKFVRQTLIETPSVSSKIPYSKEFLILIYTKCIKETINTHGAAHEKQEIKRQDPQNVAQSMLKNVYSIASIQRINVY